MTRVLLVSGQSLFSSGLMSLMRHEARIEIVGQEEDPNRVPTCVKELNPDVVIVDSHCPGIDAAELALKIFRSGARARVIELGLDNNAIHIYKREQRIAHHVEDLMSVIETDVSVDELPGPTELATYAMVRGRIYGFLAAIFNRLPDEEFARNLADGELSAFLRTIAQLEDLPEDVRDGLSLIERYVEREKGKPIGKLTTELQVERTRLVRGLTPAISPMPPYESEYVDSGERVMYASMQLLREYAAAGVSLPKEVNERPDFIGFELDFMRHLSEQEAQAWQLDDKAAAITLMEKERVFLNEHLARWVSRFCDAMLDKAQLDFYRGIARMTKGFVQGDSEKQAELASWAAVQAA